MSIQLECSVTVNHTLIRPSQVSGDCASLDPQAAAPAPGAGVVGVQTRRPEAGVFRLNWSIRVSEGAGVVEPHRRANPLCGGRRRTGESGGLGSQGPRLEGADGWFVTVKGWVGDSSRWNRQTLTTQSTRGCTVFPFGCINNVFRQEAMVGLRV